MKDIFKKECNVYVQDDLDRRKQNKQTSKKTECELTLSLISLIWKMGIMIPLIS